MSTPVFSELRGISALAAHRNYRAAAIELGVSTSALSHAVSSIEKRLGVRLFNRTTRSVTLTDAGQAFLNRIEPALREIAEAMEAVNEHRSKPVGMLRLNLPDVAALQILQPIILTFLERYPYMEIDLVTEDRMVDIVAEGFDAGIRLAETVPLDMISVPVLGPQRHLVVGSPAYFAKHGKPKVPADLNQHTCIRTRMGSGALYRWEFEKHGRASTLEVKGSLTVDNAHLVLRATIAGAGLGYVNEWMASEALAGGKLVAVLEDWTPPYAGLSLYYPSHRQVRAGLRAFTTLLREIR